MNGLMQEHPLGVQLILRHAERLHGDKTVATRTPSRVSVATFREVAERARRLISGLRALGVGGGDHPGVLLARRRFALPRAARTRRAPRAYDRDACPTVVITIARDR